MANQLETNTTTIDELIEMANALPDAGSGGGTAIETCTVTVTEDTGSWNQFTYTALVNGEITPVHNGELMNESPVVLENVICGSGITFTNTLSVCLEDVRIEIDGDVSLLARHYDPYADGGGVLLFRAPTTANAEASIFLY